MGVQSLQRYIESQCPGACVPVDLLKIARSVSIRRVGGNYRPPYAPYNRLRLVVDGECCLDRLYGGYFSDWVCGGQWNRMVQFLSVLVQTVQNNNIDLAVFFNGGLEPERTGEWAKQQLSDRKKINQVLKHVATKATPPPKVWWIPPVCLRTCLRMALRHLNVTVVCTMDDHHQEVIAFCRENDFHGLMAEDAEYAVFDPPRYFSSEQLKLTYKGSLETKEFILDEVAKSLNLHPNRFSIFAALLGNYLLSEDDLASFHKQLNPESKVKGTTDALISSVVDFVRNMPTVDNLDAIGAEIFGASSHEKIQKFKHCVQYYLNGTKDGFLHYRPTMQGRRHETGCYPAYKNLETINEQTPKQNSASKGSKKDNSASTPVWNNSNDTIDPNISTVGPDGENAFPLPPTSDPSRFASETVEIELSSLNAYQEATGSFNVVPNAAPQIVIDPPIQANNLPNKQKQENHSKNKENKSAGSATKTAANQINGGLLPSSTSSSSTTSSSSSPNRLSPENKSNGTSSSGGHLANGHASTPAVKIATPGCYQQPGSSSPKPPKVPPEVMRTTCERHQKGLMSPWIYQLLSQGEIKIPVVVEDEYPHELPSPALLFRPLRQMVYAILFNLHHLQYMAKQRKEKDGVDDSVPGIVIKEWIWNKQNQFRTAEMVSAVPLDWGVPTVQRLWFGPAVDDKKRRIRAFLSCLRSDSPLILNTSYVPQHLLVLCCVLRYVMADPTLPVLRKQELDAFLAQAVSPYLMNAQYTQNMQLPLVTPRGVELAALFMLGVECALFANDACGAPIPWLMCCPWLFFDGKLFHFKLLKANGAKSLVDVCDGQLDQVAKVERMRSAILEGLQVQFAHPPLVPIPQRPGMPHPGHPRFQGQIGRPPMMPMGPPGQHHHHHHQQQQQQHQQQQHHHNHHQGHAANINNMGNNHQHGSPNRGRGRNPPPVTDRRGMIARGGQLEIAGVVVGSWGANYGHVPRARGLAIPPQVTSVGGVKRFSAGGGGGAGGHPPIPGRAAITRGFLPSRWPSGQARIKANPNSGQGNNSKKKNKSKSKSGGGKDKSDLTNGVGRGCTVETSNNQTIFIDQLISSNGGGDALPLKSGPEAGSEEQFANAQEEIGITKPVIAHQSCEPVKSSPNCVTPSPGDPIVAPFPPSSLGGPGAILVTASLGQSEQLQ